MQTAVLGQALQERGHDVSVVLTDYEHRPEERRLTGATLINAYHMGHGIPGLRFFPRWRNLHRALGEADADVYVQMVGSAVTGQTAWFCTRQKRPFVFLTSSDAETDAALDPLDSRAKLLYRYGLKKAALVITQHGMQKKSLKANFGVNSMVLALAAAESHRQAPFTDPPTVAWLGTVRPVKRPRLWLELARRFPKVRFEMMGGAARTDREFFEEVKREAEQIPNVVFHGAVEDTDPVLSRSWVLCNTSEVEGFPTTFLEAWSRGIPTASFFDPDGLVSKNGLGWVAPNLDALENALRECLDHAPERKKRGSAGMRFVERHHTIRSVAEAMEHLLESVTKDSKSSG